MSLSLEQQIVALDASGFSQLLEELVAGESALGTGYFRFQPSEDIEGFTSEWSLLDNTGVVYASGVCQEVEVHDDSFGKTVRVTAQVHVPSDLAPSSNSTQYQLRWTLNYPSKPSTHFVQGLKIRGLTTSPIGAMGAVELQDDAFTLDLVLDREFTVTGAVYQANISLFPLTVEAAVPVDGGFLYSAKVDPVNVLASGNPLVATLDPYLVSWKAVTSASSKSIGRHSSELFIVNPSILSALEDTRRMVMKAKTTLFGDQDLLFDDMTMLGWLRRGRDLFNASTGLLTDFSMTNATGGVREYWLRYSEVAMLLAQSLAEGEKAFNYSGQSISLEVDKASVYQTMADALQSRLDNDIKPFKQGLLKKGAVAGDGNIAGLALGSRTSSMLGISVHPASSFGRAGYLWNR